MAQHPAAQPIDYPYYEDTVTETTWHYEAIAYLYLVLKYRYRNDRKVFVGANNFVYWQQGNTDEKQAPDVYVCFGARNRGRSSYKTWEERGIVPQVVFEINSESSRAADLGPKKAAYEKRGVREYYTYDPVRAQLRAFRLIQGVYQEVTQPFRLQSPTLGVDLQVPTRGTVGILRLFEAGTDVALRTYEEAELMATQEKLKAEEARREAEKAVRLAEKYRQRLADLGINPEV